MKKWGIFLVMLTLLLLPGQGKDAAELIPVEVVRVAIQDGQVQIETDTGQTGTGGNWAEAVEKLRAGTAGEIFLDTADVLLVGPGAGNILPQLEGDIRPGCGVYDDRGCGGLPAGPSFGDGLFGGPCGENGPGSEVGRRGIAD